MNARALVFFAAFAFTASLASAGVDYMGQIALPNGHDVIVRQAVNPSSDGNHILYLVTTDQLYMGVSPTRGAAFSFLPTVSLFGADMSLSYSTIAIAPAEKNSPGGNLLTLSGTRNAIYTYNLTTGFRHSFETVIAAGGGPDAMAVQQATSRVLIAKDNQIFTGVLGNLTAGTSLLIDGKGTDTGNNHFSQLTEMAFANTQFGGLLFTLDWGNTKPQVKSFDIDDPNGNYFRDSFELPASLKLTNPDGHGFTINNYGHLFIADGRGGGLEFSLTGDLLATFSPPEGQLYGAANGTDGYDPALDATSITYTEDGNLFVMDGAYGLHWYRDTAADAVPEPATTAAAVSFAALACALLRRSRPPADAPAAS